MEKSATLYDLGYFESRDEVARALAIFADEKHPLFLPENRVLREVAENLTAAAQVKPLTAADVLYEYQRLRESHAHTDVFCGWKVAGSPCGAQMYIDVDAAGAYYQCTVDTSHRTPK